MSTCLKVIYFFLGSSSGGWHVSGKADQNIKKKTSSASCDSRKVVGINDTRTKFS